MCIEYHIQVIMYHVGAQGVDERMINVHNYYYYHQPLSSPPPPPPTPRPPSDGWRRVQLQGVLTAILWMRTKPLAGNAIYSVPFL